jgi:hypothetical protein
MTNKCNLKFKFSRQFFLALIMQTCNGNGLLLKADKPATVLDKALLPLPGNTVPTVVQVVTTYTDMSDLRWYYVLGANLTQDFEILVTDLDLPPTRYYLVWDYFNQETSTTLDLSHPLVIPTNYINDSEIGFNYYVIAPVFANGWVMMGESNK